MDVRKKKAFLIVGVELILGFLHIIGIGRNSSKTLLMLSASYFYDLAQPFGFYFLLSLNEDKLLFLKKLWIKAAFVFSAATLAEIGQYFGLYAPGRTFAPFDILVYALGVLAAVCLDGSFPKLSCFGKQIIRQIETMVSWVLIDQVNGKSCAG